MPNERDLKARRRAPVDQLQDAAIQLRLMEPWASDKSFAAEGGRVLYAVDMDVIHMYASPQDANTSVPGRLPYGQVFRSDSEAVAQALTIRLADFLFFRLSPDIPLLVIPPIEEELEGYLFDKISRFGADPPPQTFDVDKLQQMVGEVDELKAGRPEDLAAIQDAFIQIQRLVHLDTGPEGEFRRTHRLLDLARISGPDAPALVQALQDDVFERILRPFNRLSDMGRHLELRDAWIDRLHNPESAKRTASVERDASALARLELWNEQLAPQGRKILYVTGSRTLFDAAWRYELPNTGQQGNPTTNFGDLFLRHPRAFVAEDGVLEADSPADSDIQEAVQASADDASTQGVLGLLRTFLTSFESNGLDPRSLFNLRKASHRAITIAYRKQPELGEDFRRRWEAYCQAMRPNYRPPTDVYERMREVMSAVPGASTGLRRWDAIRQRLDELVEAARDETWDACFKLVAHTGLSLEMFNPKTHKAARTVPPLSFDSWPASATFIETISGWHRANQFDSDVYANGIKAVEKEDPSGYAYYLVHAAIFGGRGKWSIAALLAERALIHASSRVGQTDNANGREAAYLYAVCKRHAARTRSALDGLQEIISLAVSILQREINVRGPFEAMPERFEGERIAIELTDLMFERFGPDRKPGSLPSPEWLRRKGNLLRAVITLDEKLRSRLSQSADETPEERPDNHNKISQTLRRLDVRVSTNLASLLMVDSSRSDLKRSTTFRTATRRLMAYQAAERTNGPEISFFVGAVVDCAAAILEEDPVRHRARTAHIRNNLSDQNVIDHVVFPYDFDRMRHFRELALN